MASEDLKAVPEQVEKWRAAMGFANSLARDGWHGKDVVDAEKAVGDDPQGSAVAEETVPDDRRTRRHFSDAFKRALIEQSLQPGAWDVGGTR